MLIKVLFHLNEFEKHKFETMEQFIENLAEVKTVLVTEDVKNSMRAWADLNLFWPVTDAQINQAQGYIGRILRASVYTDAALLAQTRKTENGYYYTSNCTY
jgi:hypothetical protein